MSDHLSPLWDGPDSLEIKTVDVEIIRRGLQELVSKEMLNTTVDVDSDEFGFMMNMIAVRMTQRMLAHTADETVVTGTESVPVNWWSHIILAIVGNESETWDGHLPRRNYGWRWRLFKRAKMRTIKTHTTLYRTCPHVHIPDNMFHMRWVLNVNDDASRAYWQRERGLT
jgi:hypothetical protein